MVPEFSDLGESPTRFERDLFTQATDRPAREIDDLWLLLAQRIGLAELCAVLDELGGDEVRVPTRDTFMQRLWTPHRNTRIAQLLDAGCRPCEIARQLRVSRHVVYRIRAQCPRHARSNCEKQHP